MPHFKVPGRAQGFQVFRVLILLCLSSVTQALDLAPGQHYRQLVQELSYASTDLDLLGEPERIFAELPSAFQALPGKHIDFGFTSQMIWLHLPLRNAHNEAASWLLSLNTRFMNELVVYSRVDGKIELLLENSERSTFDERPIDYRLLAVPFRLEAGQQGELLVGYWSRGTTFLPLSIETRQSFADSRSQSNTKNGGFYTAAALMFLYSLFQLLLPGNRIHLHYISYLVAAVLYVFHMDGLSFQYLWQALPRWNAFASLPAGLLINIAAASFSRQFLETWETAPNFDRLIKLMIVLSVLTLLFGIFVEDRYVKQFGFWITSGGSLIYLAAGINALLRGRRSARFYVVGWMGLFSASFVSSVLHSVSGDLPVSLSFDLTKAGILFDALMFGMAMADRANDLRRERDQAQRGELEALRRAEEKNRQLASASHDIKQPLSAIKMALQNSPGSETLRESVEYLESLVVGYLDETESDHYAMAKTVSLDARQESFPMQLILDNVVQMFEMEAEARKLRLRSAPSSAIACGDPIATMRICSNLVSNAINYTNQGGVLLGCRKRGDRIELWVCDTGRGLSPGEKDRLLQGFERGENSGDTDGHGLGLNIVATLCEQNGYGFQIRSVPGRGTVFRVSIRQFLPKPGF